MFVYSYNITGLNPAYQRNEVEPQLDFIKKEIELLQEVLEICSSDSTKNTEEKEKYDSGCF